MVRRGSFTISGTGNKSYVFFGGDVFVPTNIDFFVAGKAGGNDSDEAFSTGGATEDNENAQASIEARSRSFNDRCIHHYKRSGGSIVDALNASFVSFNDYGSGLYGFTINVTTFDTNYQVHYKASDE